MAVQFVESFSVLCSSKRNSVHALIAAIDSCSCCRRCSGVLSCLVSFPLQFTTSTAITAVTAITAPAPVTLFTVTVTVTAPTPAVACDETAVMAGKNALSNDEDKSSTIPKQSIVISYPVLRSYLFLLSLT